MSKWTFIHRWMVTTFVVIVLVVSLGLTYSFGVQAHNDRLRAQQDRISLITQETQNNKEAIRTGCLRQVDVWNTFQNVIQAATNPPALAGRPLTAEQVAALTAYRNSLVASVGPKPTC